MEGLSVFTFIHFLFRKTALTTLGIHIFNYYSFLQKDFVLVGLTFIGDASLPHLNYSKNGINTLRYTYNL